MKFIYSIINATASTSSEMTNQRLYTLELQLQEYETTNNQPRWNEQALEIHLSACKEYNQKINCLMEELYEARSGHWLLFERLSRNSEKKSNEIINWCYYI